uniref:Uncharacterized protein n=1 Tax=Solanum lycopersicum TaxID=4081 RepID=A0A3Q7GIT9_SOLLC
MYGPKKTIFLCPSWIRCWIDLSKRGDFYCTGRSIENHFYFSIRDLCVQENVVWVVQCTRHISEMYDVDILRYGGGHY